MDKLQILYNFLTIVISMLVFYRLKNYYPKYFEAKGTNQATKEDIGEITEIIENIKSDLLQQNEFLKAQLSFNNQHKLNLKSAEREAIFEFNKRVSAWLYAILRFSFSSYSLDNYKEIKIITAEFSKRLYELDLAEAHILLFMHDKEFLELKQDLIINIHTLEHKVGMAVTSICHKYSICEIELEFEKNNPQRQLEIRKKLSEELWPLLQGHKTESLEQFKQISPLKGKITHLINKRLKQLEGEEEMIK